MLKYELAEIKELRKKFNLTQSDLARRAGVSQSLVTKIESGKIDPAYSNIKKILSVFETLKDATGIKAEDIMNRKVISVKPDEGISKAIVKMRKHDISQLPVMNDKGVIGYISESDVVDAYLSDKKKFLVGDIMKNDPPSVSKNAHLDIISRLLNSYPLLMVVDKSKIKGVISKSDFLSGVQKERLF